jgi:L-amino acid N-acyltransferase YncA
MTDTSTYTAEHKVPTYAMRELTNQSPDFYLLVGPLLSRREVVAELGGPVWDDDEKIWQVAVSESGEVLGMVAARGGEICSYYVTPGSRGLSVGYALLNRMMTRHVGTSCRATATDASLPLFQQAGFKETGTRGRFHLMRKE